MTEAADVIRAGTVRDDGDRIGWTLGGRLAAATTTRATRARLTLPHQGDRLRIDVSPQLLPPPGTGPDDSSAIADRLDALRAAILTAPTESGGNGSGPTLAALAAGIAVHAASHGLAATIRATGPTPWSSARVWILTPDRPYGIPELDRFVSLAVPPLALLRKTSSKPGLLLECPDVRASAPDDPVDALRCASLVPDEVSQAILLATKEF